ncbi:unnamed protein product [Closterium sp. Yama58-4]|nr:unnamed protein product [Closterium sp. Yama58-4]
MTQRPLFVVLLLALLAASAAGDGLNKAEVISEVKKLKVALSNIGYLGRYAAIAAALEKAIPSLETMDETDPRWGLLFQTTILVPSNLALGMGGLGSLTGGGSKKLEKIGKMNVLNGIFTYGGLIRNKRFPTKLGCELRKYKVPMFMKKGSEIALGQSKNVLSWSQILNPGIYVGKYFVVHGVDALQKP